jgi:hypothetical protein
MNIFYTKKMRLGKLTQIGSSAKYDYVIGETEYDCSDAQMVNPEESQMYDGQIAQLEKRFCAIAVPVETGDKVIIGNSVYKVRGVSKSEYGSVTFKRFIISRTDANSNNNSESGGS